MGIYEPKELSSIHFRELRYLSEGMSVRKVARLVGRSESQVSHIKQSAKGRAFLAKLNDAKDQEVIQLASIAPLMRLGLV
jgi:transposase